MAVCVAPPTCGVVYAIDTIFVGLLRPTSVADIAPHAGHSRWMHEACLYDRCREHWLQRCSCALCAPAVVKDCASRVGCARIVGGGALFV